MGRKKTLFGFDWFSFFFLIFFFFTFLVVNARNLTLNKSFTGDFNETYASLMLGKQIYKTKGTTEKDCVWDEKCTL